MVPYTAVSAKALESVMDTGSRFGRTDADSKASGEMTRETEGANSLTSKEMFMMVILIRYEKQILTTKIGNWENDRINGFGEFVQVNGCTYQGNWVDDVMHGYGVEKWSDGSKYQGHF